MGRRDMGGASGSGREGVAADDRGLRRGDDAGPPGSDRRDLAIGEDGRFLPELPRPSIGDRKGELVVVGLDLGRRGGLLGVRVQCSCGRPPHTIHVSNWRRGASTRCNDCAKRSAGKWRKDWFRYADVCPDDAHRRRLCNRISACINRCHNPNDRGYPNYGGRGIRVHEAWRNDRAAFLGYLVTLEGWNDPTLELDRADVNCGYEPGNLRFVTRRANRRNQRSVRDLQHRVSELEARLRHCTCGAAQSVHGGLD